MKNTVLSLALASFAITSAVRADSIAATGVSDDTVAVAAAGSSQGAGASVALLLVLAAVMVMATASDPGPAISDERLKTDIAPVGRAANGLPLYQFRYKGLPQVYEGVMAQDVLRHTPEAVITLPGGYMAVDYARLGLEMRKLH